MVAVVQREWAAKNPRASFKDPITVDDVLNSRMIAWPFRKLMCCLVTDGGGALILTSAERAKDFPHKPVYILGTGESVETPMVSQMEDFTSSQGLPRLRQEGVRRGRHHARRRRPPDDLRRLRPPAALRPGGPRLLQAAARRRASSASATPRPAASCRSTPTAAASRYMHSGMYGMYALQESVRQMRGIAPAQVPGAKIAIAHGVGGMFAASGTIVMTNQGPDPGFRGPDRRRAKRCDARVESPDQGGNTPRSVSAPYGIARASHYLRTRHEKLCFRFRL